MGSTVTPLAAWLTHTILQQGDPSPVHEDGKEGALPSAAVAAAASSLLRAVFF